MGADGALAGRGAQVQPVPAAPLYSNRFWTGLWTQANPMRDAATQYLLETFYSASRFERMIGGQNVEITPRLTPARRPGSSVYNDLYFPYINRFYEFRAFSAGSENVKVLASVDGETGSFGPSVRDVTGPNTSAVLWSKNASAGKTFFESVGNTCFFADGVDAKKYLLSGKKWQPDTVYTVGDYIIDELRNIQSFQAQATDFTVTDVEVVNATTITGLSQKFLVVTLSTTAPVIPSNGVVTFSGISGSLAGSMNGVGFQWTNIPSGWNLALTANQVAFLTALSLTANYATGGTAATMLQEDANGNALTGTSGSTEPTWLEGWGNLTQDGAVGTGVTWQCCGNNVQDWTPTIPNAINVVPTIASNPNTLFWRANWGFGGYAAGGATIIDANGQYQVMSTGGVSGPVQPQWNIALGGTTHDGIGLTWLNVGTPSNWIASFQYTTQVTCIVDPNGNLQYTTNYFQTKTVWTAGVANTTGASNTTGATQPTWNTTPGGTTTDGAYTWTNGGPATQLTAGTLKYSSSYLCIDGSITTAAPLAYVLNPMLGTPGLFQVTLSVPQIENTQVIGIILWRTAGGQSTLVYLDQIPNTQTYALTTYIDTLPDTSTAGQKALNPFITAPIADSNDPPPTGFLPMAYHVGRIFGAVGNILYMSGGPDTVTGNGNTAFPPANQFTLPSLITGAWSTALGLIVMRIDGFSVVLGNGTASSPLYTVDIFDNVGIPSQDAFSTRGNTLYAMTTTGKVIRLTTAQFVAAVQGELSQGLEDFEIGFPIGDLLSSEYDPSQAFVVWHEGPSEDSGLFVCDGATGWYNMKQLTQPESCNPWSPAAYLVGGCSAIASIETEPGIRSLLIGPNGTPSQGQILKRDLTTNQDDGENYPAFMRFGSIVLAQPGTEADVQFIVTETTDAGSRPAVGILLNEISGTFTNLTNIRKSDPVNQPPSETAPATRFWAMQSGQSITCRHLQVQITWPEENFANELLTYTIYGRLPEKARK